MDDRADLLQKCINKIDDYFEYRYESERDREYVHEALAQLTNALLEMNDGNAEGKE